MHAAYPCGTVPCSPSCFSILSWPPGDSTGHLGQLHSCLHEGCPALSWCSFLPLWLKPPPNQLLSLQSLFSIYLPGNKFLQRALDFWFSLQKIWWMCTLIPSLHSWKKGAVPTLAMFLKTARFWDTALRSHHWMRSACLLGSCTAKTPSPLRFLTEQGKARKESTASGKGWTGGWQRGHGPQARKGVLLLLGRHKLPGVPSG